VRPGDLIVCKSNVMKEHKKGTSQRLQARI
jgi:hypothetical protein